MPSTAREEKLGLTIARADRTVRTTIRVADVPGTRDRAFTIAFLNLVDPPDANRKRSVNEVG